MFATLGLLVVCAFPVPADAIVAAADSSFDWPAWRGKDRTGVSAEKGLLKKWPKGGPALAWRVEEMGSGYAAPAVADGKIYLMGGRDNKEYLLCLSEADGAKEWEVEVGKIAGVGYPGPRSTPTIDDDSIVALGSEGDLVVLDKSTHAVRWKAHYGKQYGGKYGAWGFAESPLVDGDTIVCTPGGGDATMIALSKKDGEVLWKCPIPGGNTAAYSSPTIAMAGKKKQYVNFISDSLVGVDAETGKLAWRYQKSANGTANCSSAIYSAGHVLSASGYGNGGGLVKISPKDATEVYFKKELVNHHGGMVLVGNHVYATNEKTVLCMEFKTGKILWQNRSVGKGSIAAADGLLVVRSEQGPIALIAADPKSYRELGRFDQPDRSGEAAWPHPVIANGKLFIRDQGLLLAYRLKGK
ncbi:MAG TPA: PQQ-binding-like beta-propeller repeat protein [Planctomycetia bacterium]|nr:PQQ-binding-like beta-propeller repeat protein [Planctomycetia bacterium]